MLKSLAAAASAMALVVPPALAAPVANPAASLTVGRAATPAAKSSRFAQPGALVGIILAAAVVAGGIIIAVDDDDDSDSN